MLLSRQKARAAKKMCVTFHVLKRYPTPPLVSLLRNIQYGEELPQLNVVSSCLLNRLLTYHPFHSSHISGFAVAVGLCIMVSFLIGLSTYFFVQGEAENYFVAGHSLPLWIVAMTLAAQSVDSNSLLGNVDLAYKYQVRAIYIYIYIFTFHVEMMHRSSVG